MFQKWNTYAMYTRALIGSLAVPASSIYACHYWKNHYRWKLRNVVLWYHEHAFCMMSVMLQSAN